MATQQTSAVMEATVSAGGTATKPNRVTVVLAFLSTYIIWGSTYLAIRFAIETIPPLYTAGLRHLTAGTILLLWCFAKRLRPTAAQIRASIVVGVLFFLIGHGTLHWAERYVPTGLAALLFAAEPIFVFFLSALVAKQWQMNGTLLAGVVLGLGGVALLVGRTALHSGPMMLTGSIAILIGVFSWSAGIVYSRRSHLSGHPLLLSALSLLAGAILLLTTGTILGEWRDFSFRAVTARSWLGLAFLIVFGSVITFTAYNWLLEHYSPTLVATHTYINPIVAVLLGRVFVGEAITLNLCIATAMVIVAVFLVDRGMARLQIQL
jgi:drug/metabolite transporter (DMT)-like permease